MSKFIQSITYTPEALSKIINSRFFEFLVSTETHTTDLINELTYINDALELVEFLDFVHLLVTLFDGSKEVIQGVTFDASTMPFINELLANADNWHK